MEKLPYRQQHNQDSDLREMGSQDKKIPDVLLPIEGALEGMVVILITLERNEVNEESNPERSFNAQRSEEEKEPSSEIPPPRNIQRTTTISSLADPALDLMNRSYLQPRRLRQSLAEIDFEAKF